MWESLLVVVVALATLGVLRRAWGTWLRRRAVARIPPAQVVRHARGVGLRALLSGTPPLLGLDPRKANRLVADLVLTADRFLLATDRGLWADLGPDHGRRFRAVRSPGPGRLVIEGDVPRADGELGLYRLELVVDDAPGWARDLAVFVEERG